MPKYIVKDRRGVYEDQVVEVPFDLEAEDDMPLSLTAGQAKAVVVRMIAIERMYGCPIIDVSPAHVRDMLWELDLKVSPRPEGATRG